MAPTHHLLKKAYWALAALGAVYGVFIGCLMNPTFQRHAMYLHKVNTGFLDNVENPEEFGFSKGQVTPFWLDTSDGEKLFCWHILPQDVYLENESEITKKTEGGAVDHFASTMGAKLLKKDAKSKVVINFHGNVGHIAQGWRPYTYRSISGIPHTHTLTCDYRGFGKSTLKNSPHIPTETGLVTDAISLISYVLNDLKHPASRTVLLGQSLGTAVTAASALYFADPDSSSLPTDLTKPVSALKTHTEPFAGVILVAPFTSIAELIQTYKIGGIIPILSPLRVYPRVAKFLTNRIVDGWPTTARLRDLVSTTAAQKSPLHLFFIHARNDMDIPFKLSEKLYNSLESLMLTEEGVTSTEERRSIHGGERVKRGAFAYRSLEDAVGERQVELEIVRYGGHNEVVSWGQVALSLRRCFKRKVYRPGLDVE